MATQTTHSETVRGGGSARPPHYSYSQINKHLTCPEAYRLHYEERMRQKIPSANQAFGHAVHQALAHLLGQGEDPIEAFDLVWEQARESKLRYSGRDSWESLHVKGRAMLALFVSEGMTRITEVVASEQAFELEISSLERPLVGVVDLVAFIDGKKTVLDFKTSARAYATHEVILSDQLSCYGLAVPDAEQVGFCTLIKTKQPKLGWHFRPADPQDGIQFLAKAEMVAQDIEAKRYFRRPGQHCSWCDLRAACLGDAVAVEATLERKPLRE